MSSTNTDLPGMRSRPSSLVSPRLARSRSRTQSISSDRPSTIGNGLASPPQSVSPAPAFIAASAASQIVTNDHDAHADSWYDESGLLPAGETALVSPEALTLVNSFLDQLLFNFLHVAKATTLAALRPAVTDVLKPKLAKDAIGNADDELREYLGGADEDDFVQPQPHAPGQTSHDAARDWDVELVWKRTRLRCMVYSSLGDMEEEEEDTYMEQEHLEIGDHESPADVISPAVAIFLTSVLEYMGELTLTVAGQAAYLRLRSVHDKELKEGSRSPADLADRIVVGESDMERVALDRTLGRLWRGWKKRIRPVTIMDVHRSFSRASSRHARQGSSATDLLSLKPTYSNEEEEAEAEAEAEAAAAAAQKSQQQQQQQQEREPHDVPLPLSTNDVNEIEVPGLVSYSDDDSSSDDADDDTFARRPKSFYHGAASRPGKVKHMRSSSLPTFPSKFDTTSPLSDEDDKDAPEEEHFEEARTVQPTTSSTSLAAEPDMPTIAEVNEANAAADDSKRRAEPPAPIDTNAAAAQDLDGLDDATYEQAEVVKSPRASISSHDSRRDATARIIDVPAPKSHASSRSSSLDATRRRSTSQPRSGTSPAPAASSTETGATAGVAAGAAIAAGAAATAAVAAKSSVHTDAISESDEDEEQPIPRSRNLTATLPRSSSLPGHHNHHKIHSHFIEETIPEVPPPIPSQHAGRSASKEATPDDGSLLPIQSNSSQQRQLQTSTSGSSTNSSKQHKATKTSDDNRDVARNFEELMKSNQTITYTLTPENMRNMDSPRTTSMSAKPRSKADDAKPEESVRSSYPDGRSPRIPSIPKSSSEPKASKGRASKPAPVIVGPPSRPSSATSASRSASSPKPGIAPAISPGGPKSPRVPAVMARDARVETAGSTADFAEFIKSTGPPGDTVPPPRRAPSTATSSTSTANRRTSTIAATTPKSTSTSRYQARDAAAEGKGGDHGDLIDFIRQGPPGPPGTSHVPKHVAPFRAETPSDASLSISGARDSRASTNVSVQSSANSQAALVNKGTSNGRSYGNGNGASKVTGGGFGDDDMMPQRKQRRVRDPYAIDFSDEEDDDDLLMPSGAAARRPPPKKEESLAEFLRNYQPPPEPEPERAPASERIPKKKASAPSLIGRFRGGFSSKDKEPKDKAPKEKPAKEKPVKEKSSSKTQQQQQPPYSPANPSNSSRNVPESGTRPQRSGSSAVPGAKGHVPIQVSMPPGYDRYGPIEGAAPASGGGGVSAAPAPRMASGSGPRVPMKKFEPRDATPPVGGGMGGRSGTADLAAFLRDSAPPPSGGLAQGSAAREQEESSGFSKMFSRKKGVY